MSRIPVSIKLTSNFNTIKNDILNELTKQINRCISNSIKDIKSRTVALVARRIRQSDEYRSLMGGELEGEFGLDNSLRRTEGILQIWLNSINVVHIPINTKSGKLTGGLKIEIIDSSFKDVINTQYAVVNTKSGPIPWLEWLLLAGDALLIGNYSSDFSLNPNALIFSRSGEALMIPGGGWRVPGQYSGTQKNNWVTRALFGVEAEIADIIKEEIERRI